MWQRRVVRCSNGCLPAAEAVDRCSRVPVDGSPESATQPASHGSTGVRAARSHARGQVSDSDRKRALINRPRGPIAEGDLRRRREGCAWREPPRQLTSRTRLIPRSQTHRRPRSLPKASQCSRPPRWELSALSYLSAAAKVEKVEMRGGEDNVTSEERHRRQAPLLLFVLFGADEPLASQRSGTFTSLERAIERTERGSRSL